VGLTTNFATAGPITFPIAVPSSAFAGSTIDLLAQATDALGKASTPASLTLRVGDATPPTIALLSPTNNSLIDPTQPLQITFVSNDNSSNYTAEAEFSGALTTVQFKIVSSGTNVFTQSLA